MKTALVWLVLCFSFSPARPATPPADGSPGIQFFTGSWQAVLAEAKRQNKPIFVDIYTTWCGPCKLMAKQAFPDPKVGEKFNANFISYQIDAEKGEGPAVAKQYAVDAYPTSLYVAGDGNLIHRAIGYGGINQMLAEADKAIEAAKDPMPLATMEQQYAAGKRDADFLATYLAKRAKVGTPNGEALDAYLKTVPETEWSTPKTVELIAGNVTSPKSSAFGFLLQQVPRLLKSQQEAERQIGYKARMRLYTATNDLFNEAVKTKSEARLEEYIRYNQQLNTAVNDPSPTMPTAEEMASQSRMRFYEETKTIVKYRPLAQAEATKLMAIPVASIRAKDVTTYQRFEEETKQEPDSVRQSENFKNYAVHMKTIESKQMAMKLNHIAWTYYENITDPKDLSQALTWSARSLEYERNGMSLDTYAHLLSRLGRKAEAIKTQQEAIALEKAAGHETAEYEKSLAEMNVK